eukprot:2202220-Amphidinium_carterae.1
MLQKGVNNATPNFLRCRTTTNLSLSHTHATSEWKVSGALCRHTDTAWRRNHARTKLRRLDDECYNKLWATLSLGCPLSLKARWAETTTGGIPPQQQCCVRSQHLSIVRTTETLGTTKQQPLAI